MRTWPPTIGGTIAVERLPTAGRRSYPARLPESPAAPSHSRTPLPAADCGPRDYCYAYPFNPYTRRLESAPGVPALDAGDVAVRIRADAAARGGYRSVPAKGDTEDIPLVYPRYIPPDGRGRNVDRDIPLKTPPKIRPGEKELNP